MGVNTESLPFEVKGGLQKILTSTKMTTLFIVITMAFKRCNVSNIPRLGDLETDIVFELFLFANIKHDKVIEHDNKV